MMNWVGGAGISAENTKNIANAMAAFGGWLMDTQTHLNGIATDSTPERLAARIVKAGVIGMDLWAFSHHNPNKSNRSLSWAL